MAFGRVDDAQEMSFLIIKMLRVVLCLMAERQPTKHRFYRAWVTVKPVGSAKLCRPKVNSGYKDATSANGSEERTGEMLRAMRCCDGYVPKLKKGLVLRLRKAEYKGWVSSRLSENES
ncbi:hypothetical protein PIB30_081919 [Stylosanthes scabra]|uniref:Uncharacterized protein n=1 Tax=Stylosanthes scabra TaxID=79078 RepID=A0ABU6SS14_9FABA|nr:hypothetical protein [Stylosanthes scabra]